MSLIGSASSIRIRLPEQSCGKNYFLCGFFNDFYQDIFKHSALGIFYFGIIGLCVQIIKLTCDYIMNMFVWLYECKYGCMLYL